MEPEEAAPCRHAGAPPQAVIDSLSRLIHDLGGEERLLAQYGLTAQEYREALPAAIESLRGSMSANTASRRRFLTGLFEELLARGAIDGLVLPKYGDDTVYRLSIAGFGDVAVIQKGCPDGAHSSVRWSVPDWAREAYLWWLCDSMKMEPGGHIESGVKRLRQRFFGPSPDTVDGVIFQDQLCGSPQRICPKAEKAVKINGIEVPPPCVYVMPDRDSAADDWNWGGSKERVFPAALLGAFGISPDEVPLYTGYVGFQRRAGTLRTIITSRFGPGRVTTFRS